MAIELSHGLMIWGYPNDLGDLQRVSSTDTPNCRRKKNDRGLAKGTTLINFSFSNTFQAAFCSACLKGRWGTGTWGWITNKKWPTSVVPKLSTHTLTTIGTSFCFTNSTYDSSNPKHHFWGQLVRHCEAVLVLRNPDFHCSSPNFCSYFTPSLLLEPHEAVTFAA